jgi:hypothetical protein
MAKQGKSVPLEVQMVGALHLEERMPILYVDGWTLLQPVDDVTSLR